MGFLSKGQTTTLILILGIIFAVVAVAIHGNGLNTSNNNLMSLSIFMFGIFVAFAIANAHGKIRQVNEATNSDEGNILFIYKSLSLWDEETQQNVQKLIDNYLMDQLDYYLWDYKHSSPSFMKLFDFLIRLDCKTDAQKTAYQNIVSALSDSIKNRKQVEALVSERMIFIEWLSVILLLIVNIIYMFNMNNGSLINIISTILLSVTSVIFVLILKDLDSLSWKESTWIWEPLENLFYEMDLLPYYPHDVIKSGRVKIAKGQKIRVADYPNKYPDMSGKEVNEIEF